MLLNTTVITSNCENRVNMLITIYCLAEKINYIHLSIYKFNINNILTFLSNSCETDFVEFHLGTIRLFRRH